MLKDKTIVVGVCGGIAAYKVVEVVSRLKKLGADVNVIMTGNATQFVAPLTFQSISNNPVVTDMFAEPKKWNVEHIALARRADLFLLAPATANVVGKIAHGIADDMLTTTVMATKAPVLFVPAMNDYMYENPIVRDNVTKLRRHGYEVMEPETGTMAAEGTYGKGRLPEPAAIVEKAAGMLYPKKDLRGVKVMVTAGPTREAIDPVRYISNHSSGKMGYAVADIACKRGAQVTLVSGPVGIKPPAGAEVLQVTSALEMREAVMRHYAAQDVIILVAAVADYRSANISEKKLKKTNDDMNIALVRNPDIARELGKVKGHRIVVGTCAETNDLTENAKGKLESKNFDMIVANDVTMEGAGFGVDTNIVKIIKKDGNVLDLPILAKTEVADRILDEVAEMLKR